MIRFVAVIFALAVATSAQATSPAPLHQSDGMITQIREACGAGRVRINGVCVARTTKRHVRREVSWQVCALEWRRLRSVLLRPEPHPGQNSTPRSALLRGFVSAALAITNKQPARAGLYQSRRAEHLHAAFVSPNGQSKGGER